MASSVNVVLNFPPAEGNVNLENYKNWMKISSITSGGNWDTPQKSGETGNIIQGTLKLGSLGITKELDNGSHTLWNSFMKGTVIGTATVAFVQGGSGANTILKIEMSDAWLDNYTRYLTEDGRFYESFTIKGSKFTETGFGYTEMNTQGSSFPVSYDYTEQKTS